MSTPQVTPYGEWPSPIGPEVLTRGSIRLGEVTIDGDDVYWLEGRPSEGGRNVLVRRRDGVTQDVTPAPFNVRTKAHEYGGGAYLASGGTVWFCNFSDQRLYTVRPGEEPDPLTAEGPYRYADMIPDKNENRLICVREDHSGGGEAVNEIVSVDCESGEVTVLAGGHDFCSNPSLSPDGDLLCWLTWDHPNMPWDETAIHVADVLADGALGDDDVAAGGDGVSCFQPTWGPDGKLYFAADPNGWWNLFRWDGDSTRCLCAMEAEFALPQWVFGMRAFGFAGDGSIVTAYCKRGEWRLGRLDPEAGEMIRLGLVCPEVDAVAVSGSRLAAIAGSPTRASSVIESDLATGKWATLKQSLAIELDEGYISAAKAIEFPSSGEDTAYGFYYAPVNRDCAAPPNEEPPLLVMSHGGPTAAATAALSLKIQYWTTRGFAVLDVNYRGSTGYGRAYRDSLKGRWGLSDVADCTLGATHLARQGLADRESLAIRGGSAGGYTTLASLTFENVFRAGASYYGVADLESLARDTHKFESRYLDGLIGPYPDEQQTYHDRSPVHFAGQLSCPVIFFQGLEDEVVPPNQAEAMVEALREKKLPVAYLTFEGEQHGFRKAETIQRTLEAELYFYGRVFGFTPAGEIEAVEIENL